MAKRKMVYFFNEGSEEMRPLLGGKGSGLAEMTRIGLPVPPGFTITTAVCNQYYNRGRQFPPSLKRNVKDAMGEIERQMQRKFGSEERPLLVSVRSGARVSMPGMMDTVLNLGLNDSTVEGLIRETGNERWAFDTYRRFVQMFGNVVLGIPHDEFEAIIRETKARRGAKLDTELDAADLKSLVYEFRRLIAEKSGRGFPDEPYEQLWAAVGAVFESWNNERAKKYRELYHIPENWGTAVTVQSMVFGNMGEDSATGVAFTRDPSTGENRLYGEYLANAQGEDVVAGIRTPQPISKVPDRMGISLEERMPEVYAKLLEVKQRLEQHYLDMQDIEFTIQKGTLYLLQTRSGKRSAAAAVRIAVEMAQEGLIDKKRALLSVQPEAVEQLMHPVFDEQQKMVSIGKGLPASPGAASGAVAFDAAEAVKMAGEGRKVILVRNETSAEDIHGMAVAQGILTATGGTTSHAAVVARGMGRTCVVGCSDISVDYRAEKFTGAGGEIVRKGDFISIDGSTGHVYLGEMKTKAPQMGKHLEQLLTWADEEKRLGVRANADLPVDAKNARTFGANGVGLVRTEHMFFGEGRLPHMRRMILAQTTEERKKALEELLPFQRSDFYGIMLAMDGLPVTIRLLDPPLHEFLPKGEAEIKALASDMGISAEVVKNRTDALKELNPMLGHRGCRLAITYPEIYQMQDRAIFEAACELKKEGHNPVPEIMMPLTVGKEEMKLLKEMTDEIARQVFAEKGISVHYLVGTMIELPRAALKAAEIAEYAEFFSFGTNDLTQTTLGISRDDAGRFLPEYVEKKLMPRDPFISIDTEGVGEMVKIGIQRGKKTRKDLETGICGEHGGDPESIRFFHEAGLDYVSCSPFRVPVARLAAAQAKLRDWSEDRERDV
ncbi:MAG: pyruvate, phosphate dikinase [Methanomassiliicoccales archaeon]